MDILDYNKQAWDHQVRTGNRWTVPVTSEEIALARKGIWQVVLTPSKPVPMNWFPQKNGKMDGVKILALASAGGQQAPLFAAAGADVTVFDQSPLQLQQDEKVANAEGLKITLFQGDMRNLSVLQNQTFDFIFHPCSNAFVPEIQPVWNEAYRVLKNGGTLITGFTNPIAYLVDPDLDQKGIAQLKYKLPYSDLTSLTDEERRRAIKSRISAHRIL
jgi:ubiquinone/menaquinone biosynthesis C-methylase UbiE